MLMAIFTTSARRIRPDHLNHLATRCLWHWDLGHLQRTIYGQRIYALGSRHYVQAPEAHPLPDGKSSSGLQHQQPQQPKGQQRQQQQQDNLSQHPSSHSIRPPTDNPVKKQVSQTQGRQPSSSSMASSVDIPYDISWIFPRLRNPSKLWYVVSQIVVTLVGLLSKVILVVLNHTKVYNKDRLIAAVGKRPKGVPLVTVSNHYSCFDDPGIWGTLPISLVCNTMRIRWSMAAHDICFTRKLHATFFMYGKCIPVVRGIGVYQDAINLCIEKCALGDWVHVFPEGKVNMEKEEMRLKWGVGRIIYESPRMPIVLPMWHEGMDSVLPNVEPYVFKFRKNVTINVGQPLDLNDFVQDLKNKQVPEPVARKLITDKIQEAFATLRLETEKLHEQRTQ
ncbi:tafazzin isoform X1 [Drosophila albomicans]|uniref:Tafazzin family protein n=2 Tax=Drosophila albomicans TaxID=7291 RepID=A0A6P8X7Q4_DROAB|nr:tafazzin isoform X1 [Drosophila albomicans]